MEGDFAFATHLAKFGKTYLSVEDYAIRKGIFLKVDAFVREHNQAYADGTETFTVGHNQFSTWT